MAVVGSAYVVVRAITDKLQADISRAVSSAGRNASRDGNNLGKSLGSGIGDGLDGSNLDDRLAQRFRGAVLLGGSAAAEAAGDAGRGIARGVSGAVEEGLQGVTTSAGNSGSRAGSSFSRGFNRGISGAGDGLFKIIARVVVLGTVLATAGGAISAVVSGLFAMGAAASTAAASLVVLPGLLGALIGAVGTGILAFGGIGKAMQATTAAQSETGQAAEQSARQQVLAARAVRDANEQLADTIEDNAERMIAAHEAVRDARERLREAEEDAADAHEDIGEAREAAAERLQQLGFAVRQAAIDEREAVEALRDAEMSYAQALLQPIPFSEDLTEEERLQITIRRRNEAMESLEQARLTAERTADRSSDLAAEQAEEQKKGVEGSDEVVAAREREAEAIERIADATEALLDSQKNVKDTAKDNARAERDARRSVADALYNQRTAADSAGGATTRLNEAMDRLSPQAQRFVKFLTGLRPEIDRLRAAAGRELFPKLETAIQNLVDNFFPALRGALRKTGSALGDAAISISNGIVNMTKDGDFTKIADNNAKSIKRMGAVSGNLVEAFGSILAAAAPLINRFTKFLVVQSKVFKQWADARQDSGALGDTFERAGDMAAQLGRILGNIGRGFLVLGRIAAPTGRDLIDSFEGATEAFSKIGDSRAKVKTLQEQFGLIGENVKAIARLARTLGGVLFRMGTQPGLKDTSKSLEELITNLEPLLNRMINDFGPALTKLADTIFAIFEEMAEAGGFEIALNIFQTVADVALAIIKTDIGKYLLATLAAFKALRAVGRFTGINSFVKTIGKSSVFKGFIGGLKGSNEELGFFARNAQKAGNGIRSGLTKAFDAAGSGAKKAGSKIASGLSTGIKAGAKGASNAAGFVSKRVRDRMTGDGGFINTTGKGYASKFADGIKSGAGKVGTAAKTLATRVGGVLTKGLGVLTKLTGPLAKGLRLVGLAMRFALGPIGLIITGITLLVAGAILLYKKNETFRKFVDTKLVPALKRIGTFFKDVIWPAIKDVIGVIVKLYATYFKALIAVVKKIIKWFGDLIDSVLDFKDKALDAVGKVIDFFEDLPGKLADAASDMFGWIQDQIDEALQWVEDFIADIIDFFKDLPQDLWNAAKDAFWFLVEQSDKVEAKIREFVGNIVEFIKDLPGKLLNVGKKMWDWWDDLNDKAREKIRDFIGKVVEFVAGLPEKLANKAKDIWKWVTDKFADMRQSLGEKITGFIDAIAGLKDRLANRAGAIWNWITEKWADMRASLGEKITSFIEAMKGLGGRLKNAVGDIWDFVKGGFIGAINWVIRKWNNLSFKIGGQKVFGQTLPSVTISTPDIPELKLAAGGTVFAQPGGVRTLLGEAGQDERVEPLDANGFSAADRAILRAIEAGRSSQVFAPNIIVHGATQPRQTAQEILLAQRRAVLASNFMWNS